MTTLPKGKFIVIEGGDGSGKSTQIKLLEKHYGDKIVTTREPGGTPYAEAIRDVALNHELAKNAGGRTQFLLMWASRAEHMFNKIKPALREGKIVVTDRFDSSTYAYNVCAQEEESLKEFFLETRKFILTDWVPDLYIYLDVDTEISKSRMSNRTAENHFDTKPEAFHLKVRDGYFEFFKMVPHVIINANRTPQEIFEDICKTIDSL